MPAPDPNALCLSCGLCCDGTLFSGVELSAVEASAVNSAALHVVGQFLSQPCPALQPDCRCVIYASRPAACSAFRCGLLERYSAGEIHFDDCSSKIARLKNLAASLIARLSPDRPGLQPALKVLATATEDSPEWRRRNADLLLDLALFIRFRADDFGVESQD